MPQLALIFGISFMVALSGALSPGPLFTYTVMEAGRDRRRGWLVGVKVIAGHAILEAVILAALLAGLKNLLSSTAVRLGIGALGALALLYFGLLGVVGAIRELRKPPRELENGEQINDDAAKAVSLFTGRPVLGGLTISMSNPYWWIWWASFGAAMIARWNLSFDTPVANLVFWLGHELGDLAWYLFVAIASSLGLSRLDGKARSATYGFLSLIICGFGLWIGWDTLGFALA